MGRPVITAADVQQVSRGGTLHVAVDAIVTPLARDTARDLGVRLEVGVTGRTPSKEGELALQVRSIVERLLSASGGARTGSSRSTVKHVRVSEVELDPFGHDGPPPGMEVRTRDVVTDADGSPMAVGYMSITQGEFSWELGYDEVQIVLEGELHLGGDGRGVVGRAGDVLYVPKGSRITFGTPSWAKFIYVTFPADWEES